MKQFLLCPLLSTILCASSVVAMEKTEPKSQPTVFYALEITNKGNSLLLASYKEHFVSAPSGETSMFNEFSGAMEMARKELLKNTQLAYEQLKNNPLVASMISNNTSHSIFSCCFPEKITSRLVYALSPENHNTCSFLGQPDMQKPFTQAVAPVHAAFAKLMKLIELSKQLHS